MIQSRIVKLGMTGIRAEINLTELDQMRAMRNRVQQVLKSHADEKMKNEYLNDDELLMIQIILEVFTRECCDEQVSAFDEALKKFKADKERMESVEAAQADEQPF